MGGYWSYPEFTEADKTTLRLHHALMLEIRDTRDTPVELREFSGSPVKCGVPLGHVLYPVSVVPPLPRSDAGKNFKMMIQTKRKKKKKCHMLP